MCTFGTSKKTCVHEDVQDFKQHIGSMAAEFLQDGLPLRMNCEFLWYGYDLRAEEQEFFHPAPYFARMFLFQRKGAKCLAGGHPQTLKTDVIYLLPPGQAFRITYPKDSELLYCHLHVCDQSLMPIFAETKGVPSIEDKALAERLLACWRTKDILRFQMTIFESVAIFAEALIPAMRERAILSQKLGGLFEAIRTSSPSQLRVDILADKLNVSSSTLSKSFARAMKMPLKRYLTTMQLKTACELLQFSDMRISDIAKRLGHCDANYFHRFFRTLTGMTPDNYRRRFSKTVELEREE